ncbi:MAG: glycogen synthase GlgA [Pseudomonadota bacterium]
MNILFVSPEVFPFSRAGGLGDVSYFLPRALAEKGHRLWVVTPKYRQTEQAGIPLTFLEDNVRVPLSWREKRAQIFSARVSDRIEVFFIGCDELFNRNGLYGNEFGDYEDNAERFIFFSRAVMELAKNMGFRPDVVHCHDWPTGLVPVYLKTLYADVENLSRAASLFTFHNLGSQGIFWHYDFAMTGLGWELFTPEGLEFHNQVNMTKAGLIMADLISTVSRKYAEEVLTPEYAFGLEGVLQARQADTHAVLNGVDYDIWDPAKDPEIVAHYTPDNLAPKAACRNDLCRLFELQDDSRPIVAVISRLLDRKGFDLISETFTRLLTLDMKMVIMGMGEDKYHALLRDLAAANPDRLGVKVFFDKGLAHRIMAGADIFLMPSRYEPCGLEQLYGLKYGAVPVVRATGGLEDTIVDVKQYPESGSGFKFFDYTPDALFSALADAVNLFSQKQAWQALMKRGMVQDFSWTAAADEYEALYGLALDKRSRA